MARRVGCPDQRNHDVLDVSPRPFAQFDDLARALVELDVDLGEEPRARLAGYDGETPLAVVDLRPFPPGGVDGPMVEALAGLLALGADRFATALPARAWSMDDPVVPVADDVDLRQRVLMVTTASPGGDVRSRLVPFDLDAGTLDWRDPVLGDGDCEGWVPHALGVAADATWAPDPDAAGEQLARCSRLGHVVLLTPDGADRLTPPAGTA